MMQVTASLSSPSSRQPGSNSSSSLQRGMAGNLASAFLGAELMMAHALAPWKLPSSNGTPLPIALL